MIRVIQYNLLCPQLCSPEWFPHCKPEACNPEERWDKIELKIQGEIEDAINKHQMLVFCFQEVSQDWAGRLQKFFFPHFNFNFRLYGRQINDYMGVAIAFSRIPDLELDLIDCKYVRVADEIPDISNSQQIVDNKGFLDNIGVWDLVNRISYSDMAKNIKGYMPDWLLSETKKKEETERDHWNRAKSKWNSLLMFHLQQPSRNNYDTSKSFIIGTYHMPCDFTRPNVMTLHSYYSALTIQKWAHKQGVKNIIFAGDFNIKPDSPQYKAIIQGKSGHNILGGFNPVVKDPGYDFFKPMISVYAAVSEDTKTEPKFTNYAQSERSVNPFIATLDYIFLMGDWDIKEVRELPGQDNPEEYFTTPLPTVTEPSDHLMLVATLEMF
tara:strand:- start:2626 stop:3768 length:1143 start_codon:yes stop_codon:yes gene_type:complete